MSLLDAWWLLLLLPVLLLAGTMAAVGALHRRRLARVFSGEMLLRVLPTSVRVRRTLGDGLVILGLAAAVVAMADPQVGVEFHELEQSGIDLVVALDLSRSMDAEDVSPSRLERARRELADLATVAGDDRVGLVVYAGGAFKRMPLTRDRMALVEVAGEVQTDTFQVQGSDLAAALRTSAELLGEQRAEAGQAILIMSDGEIHDPQAAVVAAQEVAGQGIRVFAMGIGTDAAPIPLEDGTWLEDGSGQTVLSRPSTEVLKEVARVGSGAYVQSVASTQDMEQLYAQIRGAVDAAGTGVVTKEIPKRGFQWPLGLGVLLLLAGSWLGEGHRRWGAAAVALLAAGLIWSQPSQASPVAEGDALYREGQVSEAVRVFTELSKDDPDDPEVWARLGAAQYKAGLYQQAARSFDTQARLEGEGTTALYNAGNAHYLAGRLEEAMERYEEVLERRPGHFDASQNLQLAQQELQLRRQRQEEQQEQQEGESQEGEGQEGEGQEGEDQEQEGTPQQQDGPQAQQGSQQEGETQQGSDQERKSGGDSESGESGQQQQGEVEGEQGDGEEGSGTAELEDLQAEEGEEGTAPVAGEEGDVPPGQTMTAAQARKLLEGVEEARPRLIVPGDDQGDKAW